MFDMLRPHILVNSIADYYDVPGLKQQANENISYILKRSWSAGGIAAAVELAFECTLDTAVHTIMASNVAEHLTDLIGRKDFIRHKVFNQLSLRIIQEIYKRLVTSEHWVRVVEKEKLDESDWYKHKVSELKETIGKIESSIKLFSSLERCRYCRKAWNGSIESHSPYTIRCRFCGRRCKS